jgi:hypothetical protein
MLWCRWWPLAIASGVLILAQFGSTHLQDQQNGGDIHQNATTAAG